MAEPQLIAVSLRGSGTHLLAEAVGALGYTPYGTMSGTQPDTGEPVGAGEVYPLLETAYGAERAGRLLREEHASLARAFETAVNALWRVWWRRLGQPVTHASPVDAELETRLLRVPDPDLARLLPGRGCWYVNGLDLERADAGFLRSWRLGGGPPVLFHHRDVRDRIVARIRFLSRPADLIGTQPEDLVYHDILGALPDMDARITLALTDPDFPGMREARRSRWLLHHPAVHVVTHEELAGPRLGGSAEARDRALDRLLRATGHPRSANRVPARDTGADGGAGTGAPCDAFVVGAWRAHFTPEHERLLRLHGADLLTRHGAEPH
ncbi:hypothetical protein [Streptomyces subrutilus]|uniref:Sulfotransferase family protein n=1 Tax=Streptomyces subrutilus TaxID=36818 RepID=A0A5P2UFH7_9ACTN|nr:hypothetical protein [Streptomyces subrutilus]QEU77720.1 hypothetical protein CP968_04980 [Streptomyces subrutilus]WSJ33176.1 hypothetical protein OG479_29910 [Streptomyces subrutilus]GGZ65483.1 hypothetical protein GCM10010371_26660 [Streptomyces subrutilus]